MIFDSWGGVLTHDEYETHSLNYMKVIIANLNLMGFENIPKIIFSKGGGQWLDKQAKSGADALGIDWQRKNYEQHGNRFFQDENLIVDKFGRWRNSCYATTYFTNQKPLFKG